jgi:nucleoside-diphosphate-sugar epimerase
VNLPDRITSEEELDDLLSRPRQPLVEAIRKVQSPLVVLGAAGKMGPSLCLLARRAAEVAGHDLRIVAVSRFSDPRARTWLEGRRVQTLGCDLLKREDLARLPDSANIIYLVGLKFGTRQTPWLTWAVNTLVPSHVAERYSQARIVALSTGNVYPFVHLHTGGATEQTSPAPVGEYGTAALARERIFEYFSRTQGLPLVLIRLNYSVELRYGVLLDVAQKVWNNQPIDVRTGYLNCVWQGDANEMILRALEVAATPPVVLNLTGPSTLSVRELAHSFGELMGRPVTIVGSEEATALLSNPAALCARLGPPETPLDLVVRWTADWVRQGGTHLGKPTHFEVRSGEF